MRRLRSDEGFSLIEMAIAMLLGAVVLSLTAFLLVVATRTGLFTQGQVFTVNDARNAMQGIEREVRGADFIDFCTPAGSCLEVVAQTPNGVFQTVRYTHSGTELERQVFDEDAGTWGAAETVIERLANDASSPVFDCEKSSYARVTIDLEIEPTPRSDPSFNMTTTIRPRNFGSNQNCPQVT